jgi:hypothetical protein
LGFGPSPTDIFGSVGSVGSVDWPQQAYSRPEAILIISIIFHFIKINFTFITEVPFGARDLHQASFSYCCSVAGPFHLVADFAASGSK